MAAPAPLVKPDFGVRAITAFGLERKLVDFITQLVVDSYTLDNPAVNFQQPDPVPYDPTARALTQVGKVPPQVFRGRVPRTVTGELEVDKLPDSPSIIVQTLNGKVMATETHVTVRILLNCYDENPDSQGYQDLINLVETIVPALTSFGQAALAESYPLVLPIEWHLHDSLLAGDPFPHFIGEITTMWQLPSGRPLPDPEGTLVPGEHLGFMLGSS